MRKLLVTLFAGAMSVAAFAFAARAQTVSLTDVYSPGIESCYQSISGMKGAARKTVDTLWLFASLEHLKQDKPSDLIMLDLVVRHRNGKRVNTVGIICFKQSDVTWRCNEHTCNGRAISLRAAGGNNLALDLQGGLTLEGACGSQDIEKLSFLELGRVDQIYKLKPVAREACRR